MTIRKTTETPWRLLLIFSAAFLLLAFTYPVADRLQATKNYGYLPLRYAADLLYTCLIAAWATIALWRAMHATPRRGIGLIGILIGVMTLQSFLGSFLSAAVSGDYRISGCLLLAVYSSLLGTTLIEGALLLLAYGFSYYVVLSRRPPSPPYAGAFALRGNDLTVATLLFVSLMTFRSLVSLIISTVSFGVEQYWMLRTSEILTILLDFFTLFAIAFASYLFAGAVRRRCLAES